MKEFITITPTKFMRDAFKTSNKTLVLAHLIEYGNDYHKACLDFKNQGGEIWLDNSFYELRKAPKIDWLVQKAKLVNADVIVFPDLPLKMNLRFMVEHGIEKMRKLGYKGKILVTVYGDNKDFKEDLKQFTILHSIKEIDILAITYVFREGDSIQRPKFLQMIDKHMKGKINKHIHLFGVNSFENLKVETKYDWVRSMDSTLPWKLGYYKIKLPIKDKHDPKRPQNYFDINTLNQEQEDCIKHNMNVIKELLK